MAVVLTVAVSGLAAPAIASVRVGTSPTGGDSRQAGDRMAVVRRPAAKFRARYQLNLTQARGLLAA
jgi:hypothetical protein